MSEFPRMKPLPPLYDNVVEARRLAGELCDIATGEREAAWASYGTVSPIHSASDRLTAVSARLAAIAVLLRDQWVPDDAVSESIVDRFANVPNPEIPNP